VDHKLIEYTEDWKVKPVIELIQLGIIEIPEGVVFENDEFRVMTLKEKVDSGLITLSPLEKIEEDNIVLKTDTELVAEGIITQESLDSKREAEELERMIQAEIRQMSIERVKSKYNKG